jgi:hypothetical protein
VSLSAGTVSADALVKLKASVRARRGALSSGSKDSQVCHRAQSVGSPVDRSKSSETAPTLKQRRPRAQIHDAPREVLAAVTGHAAVRGRTDRGEAAEPHNSQNAGEIKKTLGPLHGCGRKLLDESRRRRRALVACDGIKPAACTQNQN